MGVCIRTLSPNFEEILWKFSEIMGKYRILDENLWGLKGGLVINYREGGAGENDGFETFCAPHLKTG